MDRAQDLLFGQDEPRRVGTPEQFWVFSAGQVDRFVESIDGRRNAYATMGWWDFEAEAQVCDKVLYDLDSPAKSDRDGEDWEIFDDDPADDEVVARMREDPEVTEAILGKPVEDARKLARRSREDNVPVVGVLSGFGIHVHQLWEPTYDPGVAMATTAYRYIDKLGLQTPDREILGQPERICRIPNCERVAGSVRDAEHGFEVVDGRGCGLYTVPLGPRELEDLDPFSLLAMAEEPREPSSLVEETRSEMRVWEDYETGKEKTSDVPPRPLDPSETDIDEDDDLRALLGDLLRMPCMVERLVDDPNPDHDVRVNATVMLLNLGLHPETVVDIFGWIGWVDFDRQQTRKYVEGIYKSGYSDQSCATLRSKGLCTRSEEPRACDCYGWSNGRCEWKA